MNTIPNAATAAAQNRQQGSLREYVNHKMGPFLKQAMRDALEVEYVFLLLSILLQPS